MIIKTNFIHLFILSFILSLIITDLSKFLKVACKYSFILFFYRLFRFCVETYNYSFQINPNWKDTQIINNFLNILK